MKKRNGMLWMVLLVFLSNGRIYAQKGEAFQLLGRRPPLEMEQRVRMPERALQKGKIQTMNRVHQAEDYQELDLVGRWAN